MSRLDVLKHEGNQMVENKDMDDFLDFVRNQLGESPWVPLYKNLDKNDQTEDGTIFSCLVAPEYTEKAMEGYGWDLPIGHGTPSIVTSGNDIWYEQNPSNFLPLVIRREFHGTRNSYKEILQELVLYLNLYHDTNNKKYVVDDENGVEIDVIKYSDDEIVIHKSFLSAFMSARQLNLLLFFEKSRHKKTDQQSPDEHVNEANISYTRFWDNSYVDGFITFTGVLGKKLINCTPISKENCSPFTLEKEYESFIIQGDSYKSVKNSCNPSLLANNFGGNTNAPHYLTPVYFDKSVLQKYFSSPSEYEVQDSVIYKHGFWRLRFDNNSSRHVCVFLGDLGRDIPYTEQTYWKSFNIPPEGREMSRTYFERSILGTFANAQNPDLIFKSFFESFQEKWLKKQGWPLFLPLLEADKHCFKALHSLTKNEYPEFDSQILSLVKITIDSINVKELKKHTTTEELKPIKRLAEFLNDHGIEFDVVRFLGGLQAVRSTGVAHRRGSNYAEAIDRLGINDDELIQAFDNILKQMTDLLIEVDQKLLK